jgi:hypothetical protein
LDEFSTSRTILFISFFLYFIIVRKSIRTVLKGSRKFHLIVKKI